MAEPRARLSVVDETFATLPTPVDESEARRREGERKIVSRYAPALIKAARASILEEGRHLVLKQLGVQRVEEASQIADIRKQHGEQMTHTRELFGRGSLYKGLGIGLAFSVFTGTMGLLGGYALFERGVTTQVAAERVPRAAPTLQYEAPVTDYERIDRREPADVP